VQTEFSRQAIRRDDQTENLHFTAGGPWFPGYEHVPYADEWREARDAWAT